jgi:hypothetical protein
MMKDDRHYRIWNCYLRNSALTMLYPRWNAHPVTEEGYTILVPIPMDMPFLLRYALQGLHGQHMEHCKEILVIPDASYPPGQEALKHVIIDSDLPDIRLLPIKKRTLFTLKLLGGRGIRHWIQILEGVREARTDYIFLHDADAFLIREDLIESRYLTCKEKQLYSLGVTPRWDDVFTVNNLYLPATWELMFSKKWMCQRRPVLHKATRRNARIGRAFFDTMIYPQYRDIRSGKVLVEEEEESFVHFNSVIVNYRQYSACRKMEKPFLDEWFSILFLSLLQELTSEAEDPNHALPSIEELTKGLMDNNQPVHYGSQLAADNWPQFTKMLDQLGKTLSFTDENSFRLKELVAPFEEHLMARDSVQNI